METELGRRVKLARIARGYTQADLAERTGLGRLFISELERGVRRPSVSTIIKLSDALETTTDYLLKGCTYM